MANPDQQYQRDISEAGRRVASMRHGNGLARVLWLLNEKISWDLEIGGEILGHVRAIREQLDAGVGGCDFTVTNALIQEVIDFLNGLLGEAGQAESLNLSLSPPEPNE